MKKRVMSMLLVAVLVLGLLPVKSLTVQAEASGITISDATYYDSGALKSLTTEFEPQSENTLDVKETVLNELLTTRKKMHII